MKTKVICCVIFAVISRVMRSQFYCFILHLTIFTLQTVIGESDNNYNQPNADTDTNNIRFARPYKFYRTADGRYRIEQIKYIKDPDDFIVHKPSPIIIQRPPTEILLHHRPIHIKPGTVYFHQAGNILKKQTHRKIMPKKVITMPVIYRIIRPIEQKVLIRQRNQAQGEI